MIIKKLNLLNFRNYSSLELNFDNRPTVFLGNNAVGKSNLLEAIYLLSITKSARAESELELIKQGKDFSKVDGTVENSEGQTKLEIILQNLEGKLSKKVTVNGVARRVIDFIGHLPSVIFLPSDINMVSGAPSLRRWHLDLVLASTHVNYKKTLTLYEQFLKARNKVLKRIREYQSKADELIYWTVELVKYGNIITEIRRQFFQAINNYQTTLGNFQFEYQPSKISMAKLSEIKSKEIDAAVSLIGPHRDDFLLILDNKNLQHFGSRGEQRTATLAFKLVQLEYMSQVLANRPILLLDDVFSELDATHRAHVIEVVSKQQTIIVTVELENIPKDFLDSARILKVIDGNITDLD